MKLVDIARASTTEAWTARLVVYIAIVITVAVLVEFGRLVF